MKASDFLKSATFARFAEAARNTRDQLNSILSKSLDNYASEDTSLVVFGSLARGEWTSKSDLDWTYLIDGEANSDHLQITQDIQRVLEENGFGKPGPAGTFGNMAFSHDIIHQIGGQNDTNKNTTQRVLLLLESGVIGKRTEAHERVIKGVISRYLDEDNHLLTPDGKSYRVPRFLLNDIVRFWRTMAVDFASKQRDRAGAGWGLRNAKLRMSRKLIFASGLLVCFGVALDTDLHTDISNDKNGIKLRLVQYIRDQLRATPLETLARAMDRYNIAESVAGELFEAYAEFLNMLDDDILRRSLENLRSEQSRTDPAFQRVRDVSGVFEHALDHIFFESPQIAPLTRKYGVF